MPYVGNKQPHSLMELRPTYFLICNYLVISRTPGESCGSVKDAGSLVRSVPSEPVFAKELINQMVVSGSGSGGSRRRKLSMHGIELPYYLVLIRVLVCIHAS